MRKLFYLIIPAIVISASCTKKDGLTEAERKAIGQYKFEKVTIQKGFLKNENVTQQYNNMILQLNDKKEATLIDQNNSITYFGKYDVVTETNTPIQTMRAILPHLRIIRSSSTLIIPQEVITAGTGTGRTPA